MTRGTSYRIEALDVRVRLDVNGWHYDGPAWYGPKHVRESGRGPYWRGPTTAKHAHELRQRAEARGYAVTEG